MLIQDEYLCLQCYQRVITRLTFSILKIYNNQRLIASDYPVHVDAYLANLNSIIENIESKPALSIEAKRIEFTQLALMDALVMIHRLQKRGDVRAEDPRLQRVLKFAVRHYYWEGSNKEKLEAIIDLSVGVFESKGEISEIDEKM